jgi:uncharacterized protein (DUF433 family)
MNYRNYITIEPNKRGGKPCVRSLRITVYEVLEYLATEVRKFDFLLYVLGKCVTESKY